MLPIQKNNQVNDKLIIAIQRLKSLNNWKETFFTYLIKMNTLQKANAKKIWNSMTQFQENVVKLTFYSSQKVKLIINFIKVYRQFSIHWEKISKVNIRNLQQLSNNEIESSEKLVKIKAQTFFQQLKKYIIEEKSYNDEYLIYQNLCKNLKQDIEKFKSYSDPLCFYNEKFTSEFLQKLKKKFDNCNVEQAKLKTQTQMLDQKRLYLSETLSQVKQAYVPTVEKILKMLCVGIKHIIDPSKDNEIQKQDFRIRKNDTSEQKFYTGQVQNLLSNQSKTNNQDDENVKIIQDFKELFKSNQIIRNEITSDQKFFYDRCENIKTNKIKRSNQILTIQKLFIDEVKIQSLNLKRFDSEFKKIYKQIFGSNGAQTYSKKFRKYFGKNFHQLYELCMLISEKRKSSIEKIYKIIESSQQKLASAHKQKKQKLKFFENRSNYILENHKRIKQKVENGHCVDENSIKQYKSNIISAHKDFSKNYNDLQSYQNQMDKLFFKTLQQISDLILKQAINKSLTKIIQKEKNRVQIFKQLKINNEAQMNFYEDPKYQIFFSEQIHSNLSRIFKSEINQKQFQQTKNTLLQKEYSLNGMIRHKVTCCGIKSEPLTLNIKESFECYLINMKKNKSKIYGILNVLSNGINFSQKSLNPFINLLQIILPIKDIDFYKTQFIQQTQVLTVTTKKGPVYLYGNQIPLIYSSMLKNLGIKPLQKQTMSQKGRNQSSCSSFLGNSGSQSFRVPFEKSTSTSMNKMENLGSPTKQNFSKKFSKNSTQIFSFHQMLKKIQLKLISNHFFSQFFIPIEKQLPIKDKSRFNYNYTNGLHKFLLKQKKRSQISGNVLSFDYTWKVTFPQNLMLKSFKHYETIYVELQKSIVKVKILHGVNSKNISLAQKVFYDQIQQMNEKITEYIVNFTEREGQIIIEPDKQSQFESQILVDPDDIVLNFEKESNQNLRAQKSLTLSGQNFFKANKLERLQKSASNYTISSNKN